MSSANTAADGLIRFFDSVPSKASGRPAIERLVDVLKPPGVDGLSYSETMSRSKLDPNEFLDVIYKGLSAGLLERFSRDDDEYLRLTKSALGLFPG